MKGLTCPKTKVGGETMTGTVPSLFKSAGYAALLAGSALSAAGQSLAQTPDAADAVGIEDIVITAQRRESSLQETAMSVASLSGDDLARRSIADIEALGQLSPSMNVAFYQGEAQIFIRGIGYAGVIGGTDSSTALHVNGVYLSRSSAAVPGFFDVERVETVRGPQGTLYGRNATGGSVNVISKMPADEFSMDASLLVGNYDRYQIFAAASGPIVEDRLRVRAAVQLEDRDGYTVVTRPGGSKDRIEDKSDLTARLTIDYKASDTLDFLLIGDYYRADDSAIVWFYNGPGAANNPFYRDYLADNGGALPAPRSRHVSYDITPFNKQEIWGVSLKGTLQLGDYTLTSLPAYKKTNPYNFNDTDLTTVNAFTQLKEEDHRQWSQEFQLVSPDTGNFSWILGLYYFHEKNDIRNEYFLNHVDALFEFPDDPECCLLRLNGATKTDAFAVFGEAEYGLTDRLKLVLGGRYSTEKRDGSNDLVFVDFLTPVLDNVAPFDAKTFNAFTPKIGLNFQATDDVFLYASASRGFKSGGFNAGSYQNTPFDPEKIWAYEAGIKSDLFDRRLRINASAFYYDYTDLQVLDVEGQNTVLRNAAKSVIKGVEVEGKALLTPEFEIDFGATYLDSAFKDTCLADPKYPLPAPQPGCTGPNQRNLDGFPLPRAPKFKMVLGAQYTADLGDAGRVILRGDYSLQSRQYFNAFKLEEMSQKKFGWLKARVTYVAPSETWKIAAFVDNITDEKVMTSMTYWADLADGITAGVMAPPRTYGVQASLSF